MLFRRWNNKLGCAVYGIFIDCTYKKGFLEYL